ncbi:MAG: hypothetical protein ACP5LE_06185, partial [Thermoplasmata archaeon]
MNDTSELEIWKEQIIEYLSEQIKNNNISYENFKMTVEAYKNLGLEILKILEFAYKNAKGNDKDYIYKLYKNFSYQNASE